MIAGIMQHAGTAEHRSSSAPNEHGQEQTNRQKLVLQKLPDHADEILVFDRLVTSRGLTSLLTSLLSD